MNDFEALVHSFGEHLVTYIGRSNVRQVVVWSDGYDGTAHVQVCLVSGSFDAELAAIAKISEVREIFMDDLSFDYVFADPEACAAESTSAQTGELVFA